MSEVKCSRCGTPMEDFGTQKLRIGGVGGEWSYIIGDIMEIEQETLPVQVHICPKCGKLEFTATEQTASRLLNRKGLKKMRQMRQKNSSGFRRMPTLRSKTTKIGADQPSVESLITILVS